jgi:hypothetical protein
MKKNKNDEKGKTEETLGRKAIGSKSVGKTRIHHDTTASCRTVRVRLFLTPKWAGLRQENEKYEIIIRS